MLFRDKKEGVVKKRWIIIIAVALLLASFMIYQYFNPHSNRNIADLNIAEIQPSGSTAATDGRGIEHELGLDVPVYVQAFRNIPVPAPRTYPAASSISINLGPIKSTNNPVSIPSTDVTIANR